MARYTLKRSFTAGELTPLLFSQIQLPKYQQGCKLLRNMYAVPQGPAQRRSGTKFLINLNPYLTDMGSALTVNCIPFVFSELQAYALIWVSDGAITRLFFGIDEGLVEDPASPGDPYFIDDTTGLEPKVFGHAQSGDIVYLAQRNVAPTELKRLAHDSWTLSPISWTSAPTEWVADNYPGKVVLYEQRAVWASTVQEGQTIWFSKAGDYYDFSQGTTILESDGFKVRIGSGQQNKITWMASAQQLLVGTVGDEWRVSGGNQAISYSTVQFNRQSNQGGDNIQPIMVGQSTFFIERLGRAAYEFVFSYNEDSFVADDQSILAPHLTESYSIIDWDFAKVPYSIIWSVRSDGKMLGFTFQKQHQIAGWHEHDTDGDFLSVCNTPSETSRETDTWFAVSRLIDGEYRLYVEKFLPTFKGGPDGNSTDDAWFVDAGVEYDIPGVPIQTLGGLDHLEGKVVSILVKGAVHPPRLVEGGQITLLKPYDRIILGLPFQSDVVPLPLEEITTDGGASTSKVKRITYIDVRLDKSMGFSIGRDEETLEEQPFRKPSDPSYTAIPLFSGIKIVDFPEGYDKEANVLVRQEHPLPMTLVSLSQSMEIGD